MLVCFLPGLFGSQLCDKKGKKIYPPGKLEFLWHRCLKREGGRRDTRIGKIVETDYAYKPIHTFMGVDIYGKLFETLPGLVPIPYDWRSPVMAIKIVRLHLIRLIAKHKNTGIVVICHSMGGNILHFILSNENDTEVRECVLPFIKLVIMVGSPLFGSKIFSDIVKRQDHCPRIFGDKSRVAVVSPKSMNRLLCGRENEFSLLVNGVMRPNPVTSITTTNYPCIGIYNRYFPTPGRMQNMVVDIPSHGSHGQASTRRLIHKNEIELDMWDSDKLTFHCRRSHGGGGARNGGTVEEKPTLLCDKLSLFSNNPLSFKGDGMVPLITPNVLQHQTNWKIIDISTKKSHTCLLTSRKILHVITEMIKEFSGNVEEEDVSKKIQVVIEKCFGPQIVLGDGLDKSEIPAPKCRL